jgi:hypothetical protein
MSGMFVRAVTIIVSLVFVIATWAIAGTPDTAFLRFFSAAVFIATACLNAWDRFVWRFGWLQKLSAVPRDVSGTWETQLKSQWVDPVTGHGIPEKVVYIVIRQTSMSASVTLFSDESRSRSSLARVVKEGDAWVLHYVYTNEPSQDVRHRSQIHHGSGVLELAGNPVQRVAGSYWTDRNSKGSLKLTRRSRKLADDYQGARELLAENSVS